MYIYYVSMVMLFDHKCQDRVALLDNARTMIENDGAMGVSDNGSSLSLHNITTSHAGR